MKKFENKVVLVTGGTSGIGQATAEKFLEHGAKVVITGRNQEKLDAFQQQAGDNGMALRADAGQVEDNKMMVEKTIEKFGKIDVLFLNAGFGKIANLPDITEEHYTQQMDVLVKGVIFGLQAGLPHLAEQANVVVTSSIGNEMGFPGFSIYAAAKANVRSLVRTYAAELAEKGIRVNSVSPGPIGTGFFEATGLPEEQQKAMADMIIQQVPLRRFGKSEEVANAVCFLASDEASYITGIDLCVDGGMGQI